MLLNVTVLNGLPMVADVWYDIKLNGDVDIQMIHLLDRRHRCAAWAERRMTDQDWNRLEEEILDRGFDWTWDDLEESPALV